MKRSQKIRTTPKMNTVQKLETYISAAAHTTFPLDYHSKTDLRLEMILCVETGNRNQNVKSMICGIAQK